MFLRGMRRTGAVRGYGGLGTGYDVRGTVVRCRGYGGYGAGVRWVRWRGAGGTVEGAMGTVDGYGGYGVRWKGTVGIRSVRWLRWRGIVDTVDRYNSGYSEGMGNVDGHSAYSGGCTGVRGEGGSTVHGRRGRYT